MRKLATALAVVVATSLVSGCVVADRYGHHRRAYERHEPDDAWDVVRRDPCRYHEYQEFAREHQNPEKRRRFAEKLAREGCSRRDRDQYRYDDPHYEPHRR